MTRDKEEYAKLETYWTIVALVGLIMNIICAYFGWSRKNLHQSMPYTEKLD